MITQYYFLLLLTQMVCFGTSRYVCDESNVNQFKKLLNKFFPQYKYTEERDEKNNFILTMDYAVQGNMHNILPLKPDPNSVGSECNKQVLDFLNEFISDNDNYYEVCRQVTSTFPISKKDLELALIHCPRVERYYFVFPEVCLFTIKGHIFEVHADEEKPVTWSNSGYLQFLVFDFDDGFLFWTFGGYKPCPIEHLNEAYQKWKENKMEGEILMRDDSHLFAEIKNETVGV